MITEEQILAINRALARGDRVEIIPVKDGVRIVRIMRKNLKTESSEQ
jgi:hypothetical protein